MHIVDKLNHYSRTMLHQFYPDHVYRKPAAGFSFLKKNKELKEGVEDRMLNAHRQISQEMENEDIERALPDLFRRYLEICWPYPFYG